MHILFLPKGRLFLAKDEKMTRFERLKTHQHLASLTAILAALKESTWCMDTCNVPWTLYAKCFFEKTGCVAFLSLPLVIFVLCLLEVLGLPYVLCFDELKYGY